MEKYCPICGARYTGDKDSCAVDGMRLFERSDPMVGKIVDRRFRIVEKLGAGGMGAVYKIFDEFSGRHHAMKLLSGELASDEGHKARFLREARAAGRISHEHIISVEEFGQDEEGYVFMIMEYLDGRNLTELITDDPLSPSRVLHIMMQVIRGLGRAHDLGVIHRDIKPDNIMLLSKDDNPDFVKILDFGLARLKGELRLTATGQVFGTPEYVSPEQAMGEPATHHSDLYSVGVMLYELLTGRLPFRGTATQIMLAHIKKDPEPPSKRGGQYLIPLEIDDVVLRLLRKEPTERYFDAHHLLEDLVKCEALLPDVRIVKSGGTSMGPVGHDDRSSVLDIPFESNSYLNRYKHVQQRLQNLVGDERPSWIGNELVELSEIFDEAENLAEQIKGEARDRFRVIDEVRTKRERLGRTVDVIASDESRLRREIQILIKQKETLEASVATSKMFRRNPAPQVNSRLVKLRSDLAERTGELADVQFKLEQLKGRLGAVSAEGEETTRTTGLLARGRAKRLADLINMMDGLLLKIERFVESRE